MIGEIEVFAEKLWTIVINEMPLNLTVNLKWPLHDSSILVTAKLQAHIHFCDYYIVLMRRESLLKEANNNEEENHDRFYTFPVSSIL